MSSFKGYNIETEQTEFGWQAIFYFPTTPDDTPGTTPDFYTTKIFRKKKSEATADAKREIRHIIASEQPQNVETAKL
jgi:hypothetical protein